jgi:hypothetical protein
MSKFLLEVARTMEWEIVGVFNSYDEINQWIEGEYGISYDEWLQECNEDGWDDANREDWYEENEIRVRTIPEIKK